MKVFVYGTMKKGGALHKSYMTNSKLLGEAVLPGFWMLSLGPYPALVRTDNPNTKVKGEVYEMPELEWKSLENMEANAGYDTYMVQPEGTKGETAVFVYLDLTTPGTSSWEHDHIHFQEEE